MEEKGDEQKTAEVDFYDDDDMGMSQFFFSFLFRQIKNRGF